MSPIEERIQNVFRAVFKNNSLVLKRELTSSQVPGWDSLANIHLIISLGKEFNFKLGAGDVVKLKNVGDLIDLIQARVSPK